MINPWTVGKFKLKVHSTKSLKDDNETTHGFLLQWKFDKHEPKKNNMVMALELKHGQDQTV